MIFNSQNVILMFLPAFFLSYFLADRKLKNAIILIYSIIFYAKGNFDKPENIVILSVLLIVNYLFIIIINRCKDKSLSKVVFICAIIFNVANITFYKIYSLSGTMPIGLSFYVFHFISLLVDNYRKEVLVKDITVTSYLNYILYFPKILSGPITRYKYFLSKYTSKSKLKDNFKIGVFYFAIGLALKCLLSDSLAFIINQINVYGFDSISTLTAWMGMYSYTMVLYFDFAGYSLIVIGLAKAMGMDLPMNFDLPFCSKSVSEFWRRWHITLGQFFRDYIYIPLGGNFNNKNLFRQSINLIIVWLVTGLWHGFKLNYILWAMMICAFIILEKAFISKIYKKNQYIGLIIVNIFMPFAFLIFSIENINNLSIYISKLFSFVNIGNMRDFQFIFGLYWKIFLIGILFMTKYPRKLMAAIQKNKVLMIVLSIILILLSAYMINTNSANTFKYFAF